MAKKTSKTVSSNRWNIAQESEKEYWADYDTESIYKESGGRNPARLKIMTEEWKKWMTLKKDTKILQVGCGPEDVINYFTQGKCYSIDPLADFYKERFKLDYKRTNLVKGVGENLPFPDNYFDVVILANVLDHVHIPEKVLDEIHRVLKQDGIFHFEVFTYQNSFIGLAKIYSFFKKILNNQIYNIHHPYMFNKKKIKNLLIQKNFIILKDIFGRSILEEIEDIEALKKKRKKSEKITERFPAKFGIYGVINYTAICKKAPKEENKE